MSTIDPRERIEIIVEQMRVAGQPLMGPAPNWPSLIEVWRLSLVDALNALPPSQPDRTKAAGSMVGQCGHTLWSPVRDDGLPASIQPPACHLGYGHVGLHSDGEATWTRDA